METSNRKRKHRSRSRDKTRKPRSASSSQSSSSSSSSSLSVSGGSDRSGGRHRSKRHRGSSKQHRKEKSRHYKRRSRHSSSSSSSSAGNDSSNRSDGKRGQTNEAYELYKRKKRERYLEAERRAAAKLEGINVDSKPRKVTFDDFPNFKRKLVVQNIPLSQTTEDIMQYFFYILTQVSGEKYTKNPLMSVHRYDGLGFVTLEFRKRDDAEICLDLDGTEYSSGNPMRIMRVKRFMDQWNEEIDKDKNPAASIYAYGYSRINRGGQVGDSNFSSTVDGQGAEKGIYIKPDGTLTTAVEGEEEDNRVFMGGIPFTMPESEVREMCESFGRLKSFNLIKDNIDYTQNKGYAFFEFQDVRAAEKAIKGLNNLEIMDKKLKVQPASQGGDKNKQITMHKNVPDYKKLPTPFYCTNPTKIVQLLNMLSIEDLFDFEEIEMVRNDVLQLCQTFGEVISIVVPMPLRGGTKELTMKQGLDDEMLKEKEEKFDALMSGETALVTPAHGKVFIKFNHVVAAKQARYAISGRTYNGRTVVGSFYPEHLFDRGEFNLT